MIREIFDVLSAVSNNDSTKSFKTKVNLNKSRIRSISSYSSNSIFYFPTIVSDQLMPEEVGMVSKMIERSYASFVVACISLMPFHRVSADDKASIETYLQQFHQNIGIKTVPINNFLSTDTTVSESAMEPMGVKEAQDFLYESWMKHKASGEDFVKIISSEVSINDMFNEDAVDPKTKVLQAKFREAQEELATWGFIGEATADLWDEEDDNDPDLSEEEYALMYGDGNSEEYDLEDEDIDGLDDSMLEAAMPAKERNKLPDSAFGLPKERKFPLHDAKHVKQAVRMFSHCPEKDRRALAKKIDAAMTKFKINMKISKDNPISDYLPKSRIYETKSKKADDVTNESVTTINVLTEGNVKEAIDSIKLSLETVSNNKIMSCPSLSKLSTIERKLNTAKNKYVKYLNRYKKKYKENQKSGSKSKLQITFNKMKISNPKMFMKQYGEYIKIINKKLKLVEKRRAELRKVKGLKEAVDYIGQVELDSLDYVDRVITEALNAPDSEIFSLVEAKGNVDDTSWILVDGERVTPLDTKLNDLKVENKRREKAKLEMLKSEELVKLGKERDQEKARADRLEKELEKTKTSEPNINDRGSRGLYSHTTFKDKEIFTKMDMEKANDAVPFFTKATVGFIVEGNKAEEVVEREVLIGIKAFVHKVKSAELISDIYNCIINKRKFLKFVKFVTGEEKSLADLLFGFKELRNEALDTRSASGQWRSAFKSRRRWAKMSVPYLMKEYTPNGTLVITKNEADFIKSEYGVDIMHPSHVKMLMDAEFLLGMVVVDQSEEIVYVTYDGHGYGFQTYTFRMLEREAKDSTKELMSLYRAMSR